uniref:Uncharacterized protein n=1 Tax=Triticum urartu TaxID=4572 RepID=A0A8R7U3Z7_TRIUA
MMVTESSSHSWMLLQNTKCLFRLTYFHLFMNTAAENIVCILNMS